VNDRSFVVILSINVSVAISGKYLNSSQSESQLGDLNPSQSIATEATKRDSGLVDFDVTITAIDAPESLKDQWVRC